MRHSHSPSPVYLQSDSGRLLEPRSLTKLTLRCTSGIKRSHATGPPRLYSWRNGGQSETGIREEQTQMAAVARPWSDRRVGDLGIMACRYRGGRSRGRGARAHGEATGAAPASSSSLPSGACTAATKLWPPSWEECNRHCY